MFEDIGSGRALEELWMSLLNDCCSRYDL